MARSLTNDTVVDAGASSAKTTKVVKTKKKKKTLKKKTNKDLKTPTTVVVEKITPNTKTLKKKKKKGEPVPEPVSGVEDGKHEQTGKNVTTKSKAETKKDGKQADQDGTVKNTKTKTQNKTKKDGEQDDVKNTTVKVIKTKTEDTMDGKDDVKNSTVKNTNTKTEDTMDVVNLNKTTVKNVDNLKNTTVKNVNLNSIELVENGNNNNNGDHLAVALNKTTVKTKVQEDGEVETPDTSTTDHHDHVDSPDGGGVNDTIVTPDDTPNFSNDTVSEEEESAVFDELNITDLLQENDKLEGSTSSTPLFDQTLPVVLNSTEGNSTDEPAKNGTTIPESSTHATDNAATNDTVQNSHLVPSNSGLLLENPSNTNSTVLLSSTNHTDTTSHVAVIDTAFNNSNSSNSVDYTNTTSNATTTVDTALNYTNSSNPGPMDHDNNSNSTTTDSVPESDTVNKTDLFHNASESVLDLSQQSQDDTEVNNTNGDLATNDNTEGGVMFTDPPTPSPTHLVITQENDVAGDDQFLNQGQEQVDGSAIVSAEESDNDQDAEQQGGGIISGELNELRSSEGEEEDDQFIGKGNDQEVNTNSEPAQQITDDGEEDDQKVEQELSGKENDQFDDQYDQSEEAKLDDQFEAENNEEVSSKEQDDPYVLSVAAQDDKYYELEKNSEFAQEQGGGLVDPVMASSSVQPHEQALLDEYDVEDTALSVLGLMVLAMFTFASVWYVRARRRRSAVGVGFRRGASNRFGGQGTYVFDNHVDHKRN